MNPIRFIRNQLADRRYRRDLLSVYDQFRSYTMIPPDTYLDNLTLIERVKSVPGCVVECGVWRGGMSAGMALRLGSEREYYLFDSFEGLPPAQAIDGPAALRWQSDPANPAYHENCSAPPHFAEQAMRLAGVGRFHLMRGWFESTVPQFHPPTPIAVLRLDGDWYESTMVCLEHLFDQVAPGGLILLDDYYDWDGCSRALHDFLSRRSARERIRNLRNVCYLERLRPAT